MGIWPGIAVIVAASSDERFGLGNDPCSPTLDGGATPEAGTDASTVDANPADSGG